MKRKCWLLLLVCAVWLNIGSAMADDGFYVVAAGGGVGTKITSLPKTITAPGFYYVAGNLTCPSGNGITVNSDDVTIDLMGFRLSGNSASHGISGSTNNVEVRNGTLSGWNHAIDLWGTQCRIINLRAQGNSYGINLGTNGGHVVKGCTLKDNTDTGIFCNDSTISNNGISVSTSAFYGIVGDGIISGNRITGQHHIGISCTGAANIIGNVVYSGFTGGGVGGILLSAVEPGLPTVMDQNTVYGPGPHYLGGTSAVVWAGKSTANPWGSNAGHE
jgi:parallel beta-helix repeat protein